LNEEVFGREGKGGKEEDRKSGISGVSNMLFLLPATKCSPNSGVKNLLSPIT
jgi:hypothetical protein